MKLLVYKIAFYISLLIAISAAIALVIDFLNIGKTILCLITTIFLTNVYEEVEKTAKEARRSIKATYLYPKPYFN